MYDQSARFEELQGSTPASVGPGTYDINGCIREENFAPFLSLQPRELNVQCQDSGKLPAPNEYYPKMKIKIRGGQTLQNKSVRFAYEIKEFPGPCDYPAYSGDSLGSTSSECTHYSGKLVHAAIRNKHGIPIPSTPCVRVPDGDENAFCGYEQTADGHLIRRVPQQTEKCTSFISHGSMKMARYKGVHFGKMTSNRVTFADKSAEPGPADYDVSMSIPLYALIPYTGKKWWRLIVGMRTLTNALSLKHGKNEETPSIAADLDGITLKEVLPSACNQTMPDLMLELPSSMRYLDVLVRNAEREKIPAPNAYNVYKGCPPLKRKKKTDIKKQGLHESGRDVWRRELSSEIRQKIHFKRRNVKHTVQQPFISSSPRFKQEMTKTPDPGAYDGCISSFDAETEDYPVGVAFLKQAARFEKLTSFNSPGPTSYNMLGMADEMYKHLRPRPFLPIRDPPKNLGFDSTAPREMDMVPPGGRDLPGPSKYYILTDTLLRKNKSWAGPRRQPCGPAAASAATGPLPRAPILKARPQGARQLERGPFSSVAFREPQHKWTKRPPFGTSGPRIGPPVIGGTPGPALYYPEQARENADSMRKGFSGRLTMGTKRFEETCCGDFPSPGHYQCVKTELLKKSFNVKINSPAFKPMMAGTKRMPKATEAKWGSPSFSASRNHPMVSPSRKKLTTAVSAKTVVHLTVKRFSASRGPGEVY